MAQTRPGMWVHGTSVQVEEPEKLTSMVRRGWGTHFHAGSTGIWFHFPIPAPVGYNGNSLLLNEIFVLYDAKGTAEITRIDIHDGPHLVKSFEGLSCTGNHSAQVDSSNRWKIDEWIVINFGLVISVYVNFHAPTGGFDEIIFTAAGVNTSVPVLP